METERPLRLLAIRKFFWENDPDILNAVALITIVCYATIVLLYEEIFYSKIVHHNGGVKTSFYLLFYLKKENNCLKYLILLVFWLKMI